ncbi:MAG: hypothetical protein Q9225_005347 [Loekoesia sp. 1 TL-2023]
MAKYTISLALSTLPFIFTSAKAQTPSSSSSAAPNAGKVLSCQAPPSLGSIFAAPDTNALIAAIPSACNPNTQNHVVDGANAVSYYDAPPFRLSISHKKDDDVFKPVTGELCSAYFGDIVGACIADPSRKSSGFAGGQIVVEDSIYSIDSINTAESSSSISKTSMVETTRSLATAGSSSLPSSKDAQASASGSASWGSQILSLTTALATPLHSSLSDAPGSSFALAPDISSRSARVTSSPGTRPSVSEGGALSLPPNGASFSSGVGHSLANGGASSSPQGGVSSSPGQPPVTAAPGHSPSPGTSASSVDSGSLLRSSTQTSSADPHLITSSLTSEPPNMSTERATKDEWSSNTWITTEKDGHQTIVPVIVGCPTCGGTHGGIIVWNFPPLPDVSFQFPKFPDLPHFHLPCVKVFGISAGSCDSAPQNDSPEDHGEDNSKPSSRVTASDGSSKPSSVSATTSAEPSSSPSSASSSDACGVSADPGNLRNRDLLAKRSHVGACERCPSAIPPAPTDGDLAVELDPDDLDKRSLRGRFLRKEKRETARPIIKFNDCTLTTPPGVPVATPSYPGGFDFYNSDLAGQLGPLEAVSRYYRTTVKPNACAPTLTTIDANAWTFPQKVDDQQNDKISVDHSYENSFLTEFMKSIVDKPNGISCVDTNEMFFTTSGPAFDPTFTRFLKTSVSKNDNWDKVQKKIEDKIGILANVVMGALVVNAPDTLQNMRTTNNRIYKEFQIFDNYLKANPNRRNANFGFADRYKKFIEDFSNAKNQIPGKIPNLLDAIAKDIKVAATNVNKVQADLQGFIKQHDSFNRMYGSDSNGANELQFSLSWTWQKLSKRDVENSEDVCNKPSNSSTKVSLSTSNASDPKPTIGISTIKAPPPPTTKIPPAPPVVKPVDPPSAPDCKPPATGSYKDAHEDRMWSAVEDFCHQYNNEPYKASSIDQEYTWYDDELTQVLDSNDSDDDVYDMSIKSVPHCDPGPEGYNLYYPTNVDHMFANYLSFKFCISSTSYNVPLLK